MGGQKKRREAYDDVHEKLNYFGINDPLKYPAIKELHEYLEDFLTGSTIKKEIQFPEFERVIIVYLHASNPKKTFVNMKSIKAIKPESSALIDPDSDTAPVLIVDSEASILNSANDKTICS